MNLDRPTLPNATDYAPEAYPGLTEQHRQELLQGSAIAPELARVNFRSFGPPAVAEWHWEDARELLLEAKLAALAAAGSGQAGDRFQSLLRERQKYAHLHGGGWACLGLDPLENWAPMAWGCWKPSQPRERLGSDGQSRLIKYEHPPASPARVFFLRVPASIAEAIATRYGLTLPDDVAADETGDAGAFWRWLAVTPRLPLIITEGAKKAAALLSAGIPAVGLPGIWNGTPKDTDGNPQLHPDLTALPLEGREAIVLFDYSSSHKGRRDVARAARRLGWKLRQVGATIVRTGVCPGPAKGADDHLAAGGTWEQLDKGCKVLGPAPAVLPLRRASLTVSGAYLGQAVDAAQLAGHDILAIQGAMGSGKTRLASEILTPHQQVGDRVLVPTHRRSLGAAACESVGVPWEAAPGSLERVQGTGLCWDSFRPSSSLRIRPDDWGSSVVLMDEISQGVEHILFGTGTAIAQHRLETMDAIGNVLARLQRAIAMDAQLSEPILKLIEALTDRQVFLVQSEHQPMAGRRVVVVPDLTPKTAAQQGRARVLRAIRERKNVMVVTTAQQAGSANSAQNLARLARQQWPEIALEMIDSENPEVAAALGANPDGFCSRINMLISTTAITSGLSIDLKGHFDEVIILAAGGNITAEHIAQAAARVRDPGCPVWIYAPAIAPSLRTGSGDTDPTKLLKHLGKSEQVLLASLTAAGGWDPCCRNESPWLRCWLDLAAHRNRQSFCYSGTVAALLEREGWVVDSSEQELTAEDMKLAVEATDALHQIADKAQAAEDVAVITAPALTDGQARKLGQKQRLTKAEKAQLARYELARRWGLPDDTQPSQELLEADRDGLSTRARFGWLLTDISARQLGATHDLQLKEQLTYYGRVWAPDAVRDMLGHRIRAADCLGLPGWLQRNDWFGVEDEQLQKLQAIAITHRGDVTQPLGITVAERGLTTLRRLLRLAGFELESKRIRCGGGRRSWVYRVIRQELPAEIDQDRLQAAWREQLVRPSLDGGGHFFSIT